MKKAVVLFSLFFTLFQFQNTQAQDFLKSPNLSSISVDSLSEEQILKIKNQLDANNTTLDQVQPMAIQKGMSLTEFSKLKARIESLKTNNTKKNEENDEENDEENNEESIDESTDRLNNNKKKNKFEDKYTKKQNKNTKVKDTITAQIFGSEFFDKPTLNFEPNLKLATPVNYILGPNDVLDVGIYGVQEFNSKAAVSVDGQISIQYIGQISVAGMTIEAASQKIKSAIAKVYSTVRSGQSQVSVTLSKIRTIKITIIGGKQPGNYSLSSLATVYNALHLAGGPGNNGSFRNIELLRSYKVFRKIDIYDFLINGDQSDNIGLRDNDVIRIPTYTNRVKITGQVKRPGFFEMKTGEKFSDLLGFASGFTDVAYAGSVNVIQKTNKEYRVKDIKATDFKNYIPQMGDEFKITKILDRFENRIKIKGAVYRPDFYSFSEGMKISELIAKADGLRDEAYTDRAIIIRKKPDLSNEVINIELSKILNGNNQLDILLKREDEVTIYSKYDFKEKFKVTIDGEIKNPGEYQFSENISLNDLILQAGGLKGSASKRVEIARLIISDEINKNENQSELFSLEISPESNEQLENFNLKPFDVVNIRKIVSFEKQQIVTVSGAFNYPGKYVLSKKNDKIYDIIKRAGGLTKLAEIKSVKIRRPVKLNEIEKIKIVDVTTGNGIDKEKDKDDAKKEKFLKKFEDIKYITIPVDYEKTIKNPNNYNNVSLQDGDEIEVSMMSESVKVSGSVVLNSEIPYKSGKGLKYYVSSVGGVNSRGWKKGAYVVYPNGKAEVASSFLFFRSYPKVTPGSQIVIPERPERTRLTTPEVIGILGPLISLTAILVTVLKK